MGTDSTQYIGSFLQIISKSKIRYQGVLFHLSSQDSTIGLSNVRCYGTEGRRKQDDGPEIPPSDAVYDYIYFKGADIKDLKVLSARNTPSIHEDPAIIQFHYVPPAPAAVSTSLPPAATGSVPSVSYNAQLGLPTPTFQGSLNQSSVVSNVGSWSSSVPGHVNGGENAMPNYSQGLNGAWVSNFQPQSLLQSTPRLAVSPVQQQLPYSIVNASSPGGSSKVPEFPTPVLQPINSGSLNLMSTTAPSSTLPVNLAVGCSASLASYASAKKMTNNNTTLPTVPSTSGMPPIPSLTSLSLDSNSGVHQNVEEPKKVLGSTSTSQKEPPSVPSSIGASNSGQDQAPLPALVTPGQLLQSGSVKLSSSTSLKITKEDLEAQVSTSEPLSSEESKNASLTKLPLKSSYVAKSARVPAQLWVRKNEEGRNEPKSVQSHSQQHDDGGHEQRRINGLLPNGTSLQTRQTARSYAQGKQYKMNDAALNNYHRNGVSLWRRGHGISGAKSQTHHGHKDQAWQENNMISHAASKFTEDFDFVAMNEKFNKDEVWGQLGKSIKAGRIGKDGGDSDEDGMSNDNAFEMHSLEIKSVYVKDSFFDSFMGNSLDHESGQGRAKFSELMKLDKETFGNFRIYRGGRGRGRGCGRGHGGGRGCGGWAGQSQYERDRSLSRRGQGRAVWSRVT